MLLSKSSSQKNGWPRVTQNNRGTGCRYAPPQSWQIPLPPAAPAMRSLPGPAVFDLLAQLFAHLGMFTLRKVFARHTGNSGLRQGIPRPCRLEH